MTDISKALNLIFKKRREFIVIGLTGRTGSGCSTVSNILGNGDFEEILAPKPNVGCCEDNEERKYNIVYNYLQVNWSKFINIKVSDIITSFILEKRFEEFAAYVKEKHIFNVTLNGTEFKLKYEDLYNELQKCPLTHKYWENPLCKELYFDKIPKFSLELRSILGSDNKNDFTNLYQFIGNNIRKSGDAFEEQFNPEKIYQIAERVNKLIKILRHNEPKTAIVTIDALRNPFEVNFFKDRYSAFYLFAVSTEEKMRKNRLIKNGLNKDDIEQIDKEYTKKLSKEEQFYSLNIKTCLELADVHVYNPTEQGEDYKYLKKQLIRYIALIMHPGLISPTAIERCMQFAYNAKLNSGCLSRQVGAVITASDYSVKSVGWNSSPEGQVPCLLRNMKSLIEKSEKNFSDYELYDPEFFRYIKELYKDQLLGKEDKLQGRLFAYCFKDVQNAIESEKNQVHTRAMHAEENAFLQIAKNGGIGIKEGYLFTTASPCELCAKKAYQLGIKKIYYIDPYPGISNNHILSQGNERPEMILFHGAIGRAYNQFYTPIMPYKDELEMLMGFKYKKEIKKSENGIKCRFFKRKIKK